MTDHDAHTVLRARAERGTPRDPGALYDAALTESVTLATEPERHGAARHRTARTRTRYATAAAALVALGIGAAAWVASDDEPVEPLATDGSTFCQAMAEPVVGDQDHAIVYLEPETQAVDVQRVEEALSRLPGLANLDHIDAQETWDRFRELFQDDEAMLANIDPDDLPISFELDFETFDGAAETALRDELKAFDDVLHNPSIRTASDVRVLDVIGLVGYVAVEHGAVDSDLSVGPMIGERLSDTLASDPLLEPQVRTDLALMQQAVAGGLGRRVSDTQATEVAAAATRLTELAETSCGLTYDEPRGLGAGTTDSGVATTAPPAGD